MSQQVYFWAGNRRMQRSLPEPMTEVIPGVKWGLATSVFSTAHWVVQSWMSLTTGGERSPYHSSGTLADELAFCLLGGHGISAEMAGLAFDACKANGLIARREKKTENWTEVLSQPLRKHDRAVRYRFPIQKARYLANAMRYIDESVFETSDGRTLRDALMRLAGVGPKTAGWVARNMLDTDDVAILDIHVVRAGRLCGLFSPCQRVTANYGEMEDQFIAYCRAIKIRPAILDCLVW